VPLCVFGLAVDKPPFEVTETGWGEFDIQIKIFFVPEANEKPLAFFHHLKLHPWPAGHGNAPSNITPLAPPNPAAAAAGGEPGANGDTALVAPTTVVRTPVHSWQYDEVVFNEPTEALYNLLIEHPTTPLYVYNRINIISRVIWANTGVVPFCFQCQSAATTIA
jgi:YEATS domain-containing protein 4